MIEYQEKAFEENVTDSTKDVVKAIAKRTYDKKKIDSDEEAFALATLLKNSKGDLNRADLEYIKQVLIKNGYGHYLEMFNPPPTVQLPQEPVYPPTEGQGEDNTANKTDISKDKFEDSDTTTQVGEPQVKEEPSVNKKPKKSTEKPTKQEPDKDVPKPIEEPSQETTMFDHAVISEKGRTEGMVIAQKILHEFDSMIVDNDKIKDTVLIFLRYLRDPFCDRVQRIDDPLTEDRCRAQDHGHKDEDQEKQRDSVHCYLLLIG
jgi:hypothetical protein